VPNDTVLLACRVADVRAWLGQWWLIALVIAAQELCFPRGAWLTSVRGRGDGGHPPSLLVMARRVGPVVAEVVVVVVTLGCVSRVVRGWRACVVGAMVVSRPRYW
jgi:hypothetical protein